MQLTAPSKLLTGGSRNRNSQRVLFSAVTSGLLLGLALIAVVSLDGSSVQRRIALDEVEEVTPEQEAAAATEVQERLNHMPGFTAGSIKGSVPTDEVEAEAIMGSNGPEMERQMTIPYAIDGHHSSNTEVADAIIDNANADNIDVTGAKGAITYDQTVANSADASMLKGSLPTYRAETSYILSGVSGNYEKALENAPTMSVVGGKVPPREVANTIVDAAVGDVDQPDCTGVVDGAGIHGPGHGKPSCKEPINFVKPSHATPAAPAAA